VRLFAAAVLVLALSTGASAVTIQEARDQVVADTLKYLDVPYLWGGQHPDTGLDCSGFVQLVYRDAGLNLPRSTTNQFRETQRIRPREVRPGDLIFFSMNHPGGSRVDHVGIYVGKGYFVQASVSSGIHIDSLFNDYYWDRLISVRKFRGF
jgi:cell wall-associated NlpC family hydrolase